MGLALLLLADAVRAGTELGPGARFWFSRAAARRGSSGVYVFRGGGRGAACWGPPSPGAGAFWSPPGGGFNVDGPGAMPGPDHAAGVWLTLLELTMPGGGPTLLPLLEEPDKNEEGPGAGGAVALLFRLAEVAFVPLCCKAARRLGSRP